MDDKILTNICPHWFGWYFYVTAFWVCVHAAAGTASVPAAYATYFTEPSDNNTDINVRSYSTHNPSIIVCLIFFAFSLLLGHDVNEEFAERMEAAKNDLEKKYPGRVLCVIEEAEKHI